MLYIAYTGVHIYIKFRYASYEVVILTIMIQFTLKRKAIPVNCKKVYGYGGTVPLILFPDIIYG